MSLEPTRWGPVSGVVFDTDGVITRTAEVHAEAWKRLFDAFLADTDPTERPFSEHDYLAHVDGRSRADGIIAFLRSRGLELPLGQRDDPAAARTVWGLGNRKNEFFRTEVQEHGVARFDSTMVLVEQLRTAGVRLAAVSASENQRLVLDAAGVTGCFDVLVDGIVSRELGLAGKPAPDLFVEAARRIGTEPSSTAVIEDATSGVEAGRAGGFSPVIGVDRAGDPVRLEKAGAHVVVAGLAEVTVEHGDGGVWLGTNAVTRTRDDDPRG